MKPLNILIFGATGMVGQGVLRECLQAPDVERVTAMLAVARRGAPQAVLEPGDIYDAARGE